MRPCWMLNDTQHQSRNISHISRDSCLQWKEDDRTYTVSHILISHGGRRGRGGVRFDHTRRQRHNVKMWFWWKLLLDDGKGYEVADKKTWDNRTDKSIVEGKSEKRQSSFGCCSRSVATPAWPEPQNIYTALLYIWLWCEDVLGSKQTTRL